MEQSETPNASQQRNQGQGLAQTGMTFPPATCESVTPQSNTGTALHHIENNLVSLQERYHALNSKGDDSSKASSPTAVGKKVIKLSHIQTKKPSNLMATEENETPNYVNVQEHTSMSRRQATSPATPGTVHKATVLASTASENLHSGSSIQEFDSVDDQGFQIELKNRLTVAPKSPMRPKIGSTVDGAKKRGSPSHTNNIGPLQGAKVPVHDIVVSSNKAQAVPLRPGQMTIPKSFTHLLIDIQSQDKVVESLFRQGHSSKNINKQAQAADVVPKTINMNLDPFHQNPGRKRSITRGFGQPVVTPATIQGAHHMQHPQRKPSSTRGIVNFPVSDGPKRSKSGTHSKRPKKKDSQKYRMQHDEPVTHVIYKTALRDEQAEDGQKNNTVLHS